MSWIVKSSGTFENGNQFWLGVLFTEAPLKRVFPQTYSLSYCKKATVADFATVSQDGTLQWNVQALQNLSFSILEEATSFMRSINWVNLRDRPDCLVWRDNSDVFHVMTCYWKILELPLKFFNGVVHFDWNLVWSYFCHHGRHCDLLLLDCLDATTFQRAVSVYGWFCTPRFFGLCGKKVLAFMGLNPICRQSPPLIQEGHGSALGLVGGTMEVGES